MKLVAGMILTFGLLFVSACTADRQVEPSNRASASPPPVAAPAGGLPPAVAETRRAILAAATEGDYESLQEVLEPSVFLSDFGFGMDPTERWQRQGKGPLEMMAVLLTMSYIERDTNEGHLFQWPAYDADTRRLSDIRPADRGRFLNVMTPKEFRRMVPNSEFGYVGPRLGILEDGTWWFFVRGGP